MSKATLLHVHKIWDKAKHNAFVDLIEYGSALFCAFRESDSHAGGVNGKIRILKSLDGATWTDECLLSQTEGDLRDPKLSIMPDGRLLLTLGVATYTGKELEGIRSAVTWSDEGSSWSELTFIDLGEPNEWLWRVTWFEGVGYGASYRFDPHDKKKPWTVTLFQTKDGKQFAPSTQLDVPNSPNETTLRFLPDGTMVALVRRHGPGWIGTAKAPYTHWSWKEIQERLGGANFLIMPDGSMWAGSRLERKDKKKHKMHTALAAMTTSSYEPLLILPSGGDTSYPGMCYRDGMLYMCYYSSHEGKAAIYMAKIQIER